MLDSLFSFQIFCVLAAGTASMAPTWRLKSPLCSPKKLEEEARSVRSAITHAVRFAKLPEKAMMPQKKRSNLLAESFWTKELNVTSS